MLRDNDKTMENTRKLKIHTKHQPRAYSRTIAIPEIRLEGKWLEKLGFTKGQMVIVTQKKNKLIITPIKEQKIITPAKRSYALKTYITKSQKEN